MFEQLSDKLNVTFERLRGRPRVSEADLEEALRDVRVALLEADVNLKVVRQLIATVRERALGEKVLESITGAQQVVKIVHDALVEMLGGEAAPIERAATPPTVVLLVGLQGSGKTTTAGKLANTLRKQGRHPLLVAADVHRPAAIDQLRALGKQLGIPVTEVNASRVASDVAAAIAAAPAQARDTVIVDTAGRLHIDDEMMKEVEAVVAAAKPHEVLLVVDAMTGQDAVEAASAFKARLPISGLVLTKVDSDARGGASLSIRAATGIPVKLLGVGEKLDALEVFHPDRLAQRILGMGDVLTLVEKAQEAVDRKTAEEQTKKLLEARFTFEDFYATLQQVKRMGPIGDLMKMIPGMGAVAKQLPTGPEAEAQMKRIEAMISSMTRAERVDPTIINGSRRRRIAAGSGTTVTEVNQLIKQFAEMQKLMKQMGGLAKSGRLPRIPGMPMPR
ncbi:MAG: signal recognition particle protein [Chloroflexi bacterium]|nr:MAG: signal recognition particle protein [Chloroflexota bacterium]TMC30706.1 MAG: signal recognition particle protein [Chloroflexota bacterium]TMC34251.1 MAG: signal recognition particle protein [Chloroflexota bacterium]TME37679.1 MAG: signal recognition particle protein [Chloroflexota bacterium]